MNTILPLLAFLAFSVLASAAETNAVPSRTNAVESAGGALKPEQARQAMEADPRYATLTNQLCRLESEYAGLKTNDVRLRAEQRALQSGGDAAKLDDAEESFEKVREEMTLNRRQLHNIKLELRKLAKSYDVKEMPAPASLKARTASP